MKEELRRLQKLQSQKEETLEEEKHKNVQLEFGKKNLYMQVRAPKHHLIIDISSFCVVMLVSP